MRVFVVYWGYIRNNGNKLETTIIYWGNYYSILGLYGESSLGVIGGYMNKVWDLG